MIDHHYRTIVQLLGTPEALRSSQAPTVVPGLRSPLLLLRSHGGIWPLPQLPPAADVEITQCVERLADAKYAADQLLRSNGSAFMHPALMYGATRSIPASQFLAGCVPFLGEPGNERFAARVPTRWIIGWSWKSNASGNDPNLVPGILAHLVADERANLGLSDYAELTWWPALGLVIAHEGKNRIELLRRMHASTIAGDVATAHYPPPTMIRLYRVGEGANSEIWAVLEDRWLQRLPWHRVGEDLLRAYGIADPAPWPSDFPPTTIIRAALVGHPGRYLDITTCIQPVVSNERIEVSVAKLPGVRWKQRRVALAIIGCVVFILVFYAAGLTLLGTALASLLAGACVAVGIPWFTIRKPRPSDL